MAVLLACGCREELGPEIMPTALVSGRVVRSGVPVRGGWVEFLPVEGTVGRLTSARIGPDGRFSSSSVPVGTLGLRIVGASLYPAEARFLSQGYYMRRSVPPTGLTDMEIDLALETAKLQAALRSDP